MTDRWTNMAEWPMLPWVAGIWLVAISGWTMLRFWQDKQLAIARGRRIPEADLLWLAAIGGLPGALLARRLFRHKTRKQPFSTYLWLIGAIQAGLVAGVLLPG